tara:strand:- start:1622 stop:2356 length:735 start_codon:yes stop_codon:yes gene_type:complete
MVVRKNSRKRSFRKNKKKSKKKSFRKNRKKSQKRGGGKGSFWDWLPPIDTIAVKRICRKVLKKGQSNSGIFVPYTDPFEYVKDFSFAYQEWWNSKGYGDGTWTNTAATLKTGVNNLIKALGFVGATAGGLYTISSATSKNKKRDPIAVGKRKIVSLFGAIFALKALAYHAESKEVKRKYHELLNIVAEEWNNKYPKNKITGKKIADMITDNPKAKTDIKKIKILNKLSSGDRNALVMHNQAMMM